MCYSYKISLGKKQLEMAFAAILDSDEDIFNGAVSGFTHPRMPIIRNENPKEIELSTWGLIPNFIKDDRNDFWKKTNTLNAKIETLKEKPSYRQSAENRCLVLATEFFEWKHIGKEKYKHRIWTKDEKPFAFAGIYQDDSFTILTTEANELMADIHNSKKRMPVVLRKEEEELWLSGEPLENYHNRKEVELLAQPLDDMPMELF
ncbi:SOS response-associated peptidase [Flavobacterium qiangtangense]|uniref:Abasic site processing protein n=1 Tax=Flavobacterium qiangtangense TaxID=1442595 RepID=A0ABW1PLY0_9FLAO